jgi:hypothetical protein
MLILVEDELAREILTTLFIRYDRALTKEAEIICAGGEGQVKNGLKILQDAARLSRVGVLDGDKRNITFASVGPVFFLPGTSFPEDELISAASRDLRGIATRINVSMEDMLAAISSCRGMDHQYWIKVIARHLGFTESVITYELTQVWLADEIIQEEAKQLVNAIRANFAKL